LCGASNGSKFDAAEFHKLVTVSDEETDGTVELELLTSTSLLTVLLFQLQQLLSDFIITCFPSCHKCAVVTARVRFSLS